VYAIKNLHRGMEEPHEVAPRARTPIARMISEGARNGTMEREIPSTDDRSAQRQGGTSHPILPNPNPAKQLFASSRDGGGERTTRSATSTGIPPELRHSSLCLCNHSPETRTNRATSCVDLSSALGVWGIGGGKR
jgi:hypothetical protein